MTEQQTIQAIHSDFEYELLGDLTTYENPFIDGFAKPDGMTFTEFWGLVRHYRRQYPHHNFISEAQVKNICLRYGLVMGPMQLFTGAIPEKNQWENRAFSLDLKDSQYLDKGLGRQVVLGIYEGVAQWGMDSGHGSSIRVSSGWFPLDRSIKNLVLPIGEGIVLVNREEYRAVGTYDVFLKVQVCDSEWMVFAGTIDCQPNSRDFVVMMQSRLQDEFSRRSMRMVDELSFELDLPIDRLAARLQYLDINSQVQRQVVAPAKMFEAHKESVEVRDGYRLRFKPSGYGRFSVGAGVDDPIILQPVPAGFLVVSKWGLEQFIPELENGKSN